MIHQPILRIRLMWAVLACFAMPLAAQNAFNPDDYPRDTVNGEIVYRYTVEKGIGLYRIGVNFGVSQNDIIRLNPQLQERGLHFGETILIPTGLMAQAAATPAPAPEARPAETRPATKHSEMIDMRERKDLLIEKIERRNRLDSLQAVHNDSIAEAERLAADTLPREKRTVELALMLPFESQQTKRSTTAERMMEFYQGALLALHDMQNDSIRYRLRVYDTERSERKVMALCDSTELDSVSGILGLVYPIQIAHMALWCADHRVPLILPFSNETDLAASPAVMQFNSSEQQDADSLCRWIRAHKPHCIAIEVQDAEMSSSSRTLRNTLHRAGIQTTGLLIRDLMNDSAAWAFDRERENLILFHNDRYQQIRLLLPHIDNLRRLGYKIRLVSRYTWQKEEVGMPQVYTSIFTAQSDLSAYEHLWNECYKAARNSDTPRYDLLGYDLMRELINRVHGRPGQPGLQSDIRWKQIGQGGWQNANVKVITLE